jgi:uncharacterized membrane protein YdjX (TVP38/TMEM64 family)
VKSIASPRRRSRARRTSSPSATFPWRPLITWVAGFGLIALVLAHWIDVETLHEHASGINGVLAFALLVMLPLIGFPASVLHVVAGMRFGAPLGLALVSLSIALQLLASYGLVRIWRTRFERIGWIARLRKRIPDGAHASVTTFTVLLPGAPFTAVNYVLPLIGVPLRTLLLCAWPLHTLRATITVALGDQSAHLTGARLAVLGGYAMLILGASWWGYRRLQRQFSDPPRAAGDRKRRA